METGTPLVLPQKGDFEGCLGASLILQMQPLRLDTGVHIDPQMDSKQVNVPRKN